MKRMRAFIRRLSVCGLLAGCGGGGGGAVTIDDLGTELAKVSCSKTFECCTSAEVMDQFANITYNGQPITTEAQCEGFTGGLFTSLLTPEYKDSIAAGRIAYDADAAGACFDAAANLSCSAYAQLTGHESVHCDTPFIIPKVADGGTCAQDYECTGGNCEGATNSSANGTCKPLPTEGQDCSQSCAQGLFCGYDQTAMKETCQPLEPNGTSCSGDDECTSGHCVSSTCAAAPAPVCDGM
jgi:hypothetical protein